MDNNMLSRRPTSVHRGEANLLALVLVIGIVAIMVVGVMSFASNISDSNNIGLSTATAAQSSPTPVPD